MTDDRAGQLAVGLDRARQRLAAAERAAARPPGSVALVVVTKTFPASDVRLLAGLGVDQVGESREPEAGEKAAACADLPLRWHQVGQVQTRRAAAVARWADVVHSVDRPRLVTALARAAAGREAPLECLLQVSLDDVVGGAGDAGPVAAAGPADDRGASAAPRGGAAPADLAALADLVAGTEGLRLGGVMAVAPRGADPARAFARLQELAAALVRDHPAATAVSAGMSADLEAAVASGATVVRVGSAILGTRPPQD